VGYRLLPTGKRGKATHYLGNDPEQAETKHTEITKAWTGIKQNWHGNIDPQLTFIEFIRGGLPGNIRHIAALD